MTVRGAVVVAILNNRLDFELAQRGHWYRIPVGNVQKWLKGWWVPEWLAFYQTKVFGPEAYTVQWYARVRRVERVQRKELFPDERSDPKADHWYYKTPGRLSCPSGCQWSYSVSAAGGGSGAKPLSGA